MAVKLIPEGYHTVSPFIIVKDIPKLMEFLTKAFNAKEKFRMYDSDNVSVMHAEMTIGDSVIMLSEVSQGFDPAPAGFFLYVEDVDAVYKSAINAGGKSIGEPKDQFYGDRTGGITDPWDNKWWMGTHIEDVSPEELKK